MGKTISFDLWKTLICSNPQFRVEKCSLIRKHFNLGISDEEIVDSFKRVDVILDKIQEKFLVQPELLTSWALVLSEIGVEQTSVEDIKSFLRLYYQLFLVYPPVLLDDVEWLFEKLFRVQGLELYILSNTILVNGEVLDQFLKTTFLGRIKVFFSDTHFPKPDCRAFGNIENKPFIHVGDNPIADGKCKDFGIEFYQVRANGKSLKDFWQYIEHRL